MSAIEKLEKRLAALEVEIAKLKESRLPKKEPSGHAWLNRVYGSFADDPEYLDAMRLGREQRQVGNERRKRKKRKNLRVDS